jgi:hypothetical protein
MPRDHGNEVRYGAGQGRFSPGLRADIERRPRTDSMVSWTFQEAMKYAGPTSRTQDLTTDLGRFGRTRHRSRSRFRFIGRVARGPPPGRGRTEP